MAHHRTDPVLGRPVPAVAIAREAGDHRILDLKWHQGNHLHVNPFQKLPNPTSKG